MKLNVLILCVYRCMCIYIILGGRDPYFTGGMRRRCNIYIYPEKGTRIARAECEDGAIYISYWEEGTRIARAECEDGAMIYIYLYLYK